MTTKTITGRDAITQARRTGAQLYAYSDPVSEGGPISLAEAEERVAIDPSLVYLPAAVEWSQTDDGANVRVSDGEETYFARVPSDWDTGRVADAFLATYEVLPEVAREWGSKAAALRDVRAKLRIDSI